jgi:hypothetical protein
LNALRDTIRTWDWRAPAGEGGTGQRALSDAADETNHLAVPADPLVAGDLSSPPEVPEGRVEVREDDPAPIRATEAPTDVTRVGPVAGAIVATAATAAVVDQPPAAPIEETPVIPEPPEETPAAISAEAEPRTRLWSRKSTKIVIIALIVIVAILAVVLALGVGRKHSDSGNASTQSATTQSTTAQSAAGQSTTTTVAPPLDAAQLTQYDGYASALEKANATAAAGIAAMGSTPTVAQLTPVISSYLAAMNLYNLQIHYIQWPASMQADVQADYTQLSAYLGFLQSVGAVTPPSMNAWLSQLQTVGASAQTADNKIRNDLGVASSSSFP